MIIINNKNINIYKGIDFKYQFNVRNEGLFKSLIWSTPTKLPLNLTLTKKGLLQGIAKTVGVFKIIIQVVNNKKQLISKEFILNIKKIPIPIQTVQVLYFEPYSLNVASVVVQYNGTEPNRSQSRYVNNVELGGSSVFDFSPQSGDRYQYSCKINWDSKTAPHSRPEWSSGVRIKPISGTLFIDSFPYNLDFKDVTLDYYIENPILLDIFESASAPPTTTTAKPPPPQMHGKI